MNIFDRLWWLACKWGRLSYWDQNKKVLGSNLKTDIVKKRMKKITLKMYVLFKARKNYYLLLFLTLASKHNCNDF